MRELRFTATWEPARVLVGLAPDDGVLVTLEGDDGGGMVRFHVGPVRTVLVNDAPLREPVDAVEAAYKEAERRALLAGGRLERFARRDEADLPAVEVAVPADRAADEPTLALAYIVAAKRCA